MLADPRRRRPHCRPADRARRQDRARHRSDRACRRPARTRRSSPARARRMSRDGAALSRFLAWLDARGAARKAHRDRRGGAARRASGAPTALLQDTSLPTISGAGPNGAIVHYRVTKQHQSVDRTGPAAPRRFRRPIPGRHDRRHAHGRGRHADRGDARPLHPRAQGPHPARARAFSPKARPARSSTPSRAGFCGTPGSTTATARATASAPISRCTKARRASRRSAPRRSNPA